jgi:hypothetical protein
LICRCPLTRGSGSETLCPEVTPNVCKYKGCEWSTYPKLITAVQTWSQDVPREKG